MPRAELPLPELTDEHRAIAHEYCAKEDLGAIARRCFGEKDELDKRIDGRSQAAKAIKKYLAGEGKETTTTEPPVSDMVLTDEQKKQVEDLASHVVDGKTLELTQIIWNDRTLTPLSKQARLVREYYKTLYPDGINMSEEPVDEREYRPPPSLTHLVGLVNTFILQSDNRKTYNATSLKPSERKCLEALMRYMRVYRLKYTASQYDKLVDRDLFLSTFVRWSYDKPDLTEIEVDHVISAAAETVTVAQLEREIQMIRKYHEAIINGEEKDETTGRKKRFGMTEIEQINGVRTKHDASKKRVESLMGKLEIARSERDKERRDRYVSIVDILDAWQKNQDLTGNGPLRDSWVQGGIDEKAEDAKEVERLSALEEMVALVSGQSKEEASA